MIGVQLFLISFVFLYQTTLSAVVQKQSNSEDVNNILKRIENKFSFVRHDGNFTEFLNEDMAVRPCYQCCNWYYNCPPEYWDWRDHDHVSPVKDQKKCNACWAFSSVASIESHYSIYGNQKVQLSEQFLIDCIQYGNSDAPKCGHYSLLNAYSDIITEYGGVLKENEYRPYTAAPGTCTYQRPPPTPLAVTGFARVPPNEDTMVNYLYTHGPLSAAINSQSMANYNGNYIDEPTEDQCSSHPDQMNHAVLIVGYNVYDDGHKRVPYWIIKNSWGVNWGVDGYYFLVRGRNACGIANDVSFPILPVP